MPQATLAKHEQIADEVRSLIRRGQLEVGGRLPSEVNLASEYNCSVNTIRRALSTLIQEGRLRAKRRSGVYVQEKPRQPILGLMVPNVINPEHAALVQAVTQSAARRGLTVSLYCSMVDWTSYADDKRPQFQFASRLAKLSPTGVLCCPLHIPDERALRRHLRELSLPYVVVNDYWTDCDKDPLVSVDQRAAARLAVDHLAELGHERLAMLVHPQDEWPASQEAFRGHLAARGLPHGEECIIVDQETAWCSHLINGEKPTFSAVVVPYHQRASLLVEAMASRGLSTPDDISIVCLGGRPTTSLGASVHGITFTSTISPIAEIAERALSLLLDEAIDTVCHFSYKPELHVGSTTAPALPKAQEAHSP